MDKGNYCIVFNTFYCTVSRIYNLFLLNILNQKALIDEFRLILFFNCLTLIFSNKFNLGENALLYNYEATGVKIKHSCW